MEKLTGDNFKKGFLMDEELMAGISEVPDAPGTYSAYVVRHTTGETLGVQQFTDIFEAVRTLNDIPRKWAFQSVSRCGSGNCKAGGCGKNGGGCGKKSTSAEGATENPGVQNLDEVNPEEASACSTGNC